MHLDSALVNVDESFRGFGSWYLPRVHHWKFMLILFIKKKVDVNAKRGDANFLLYTKKIVPMKEN